MKDLTSGSIYKSFFVFALPMVLSGVLSQLYATIDTVIAGRLIGEGALGALGATAPLDTFINSIFWGFSSGIGIYTANLFGAKKYYRLKNAVVSNLWIMSAVIVLLCLFLVAVKDYIFVLLRIDSSILADADTYFTVCTLGKVFTMLSTAFVHILNGMGDGVYPFKMSLISSALNVFGNIFSVAVLKMGILGIALSTVISAAIVDLCYFAKLKSCFKLLKADRHKTVLSKKIIKETFSYSLPVTVQQSIMYFSSLALSPTVNGIGDSASACYTVALRFYDFNAALYQNSAKTIGSHTAQCYGAGNYKRIRKGFKVGILQNLLFSAPFFLLCVLLPDRLCGLFFTDGASPTAVKYSEDFLKYFLCFAVFNLLGNACHHFFRGIKQMRALLVSTLCGSLTRIAVSILLAPKYGIYGIFIGWAMSWLADALSGMLLYRFGKWRSVLCKK